MNEKQAWRCFRETGSVEAYLQYARLVHARSAQMGVQAAGEVSDADRNAGTRDSRKQRGGKR